MLTAALSVDVAWAQKDIAHANGVVDGKPEKSYASAMAQAGPLSERPGAETSSENYLNLRLADGSVVRVLKASDARLKQLRTRSTTGSFETILNVPIGNVEPETSQEPEVRSFEVQTPGVIASVRG